MSRPAEYRTAPLRISIRSWSFIVLLALLIGVPRTTFAQSQSCGYYVQTKHERLSAQLRDTWLKTDAGLTEAGLTKSLPMGQLPMGQLLADHLLSDLLSDHLLTHTHVRAEYLEMDDSQAMPTSDRKPHHCDGPGCRQQPTLPPLTFHVPAPESHGFQVHGILSNLQLYPDSNCQWYPEASLLKAFDIARGYFRPPRVLLSVNA